MKLILRLKLCCCVFLILRHTFFSAITRASTSLKWPTARTIVKFYNPNWCDILSVFCMEIDSFAYNLELLFGPKSRLLPWYVIRRKKNVLHFDKSGSLAPVHQLNMNYHFTMTSGWTFTLVSTISKWWFHFHKCALCGSFWRYNNGVYIIISGLQLERLYILLETSEKDKNLTLCWCHSLSKSVSE